MHRVFSPSAIVFVSQATEVAEVTTEVATMIAGVEDMAVVRGAMESDFSFRGLN
jgi:hypothetical protein